MFLDPTETYTLTWNRDEGVFTVPVVVPQVFFTKDDNTNEQRSQTLGVSSTTEFSLVGNPYVLTPNQNTRPMAAALSQTRVALYNRNAGDNLLRTLDFDGTDWVQTGNALTMSFEGANTPDFPSFSAPSSRSLMWLGWLRTGWRCLRTTTTPYEFTTGTALTSRRSASLAPSIHSRGRLA